MALIENTLFDGKYSKIGKAIEAYKTFEPKEGYYLAFSGGKDSQVVYELAKMSGVKFDAHYNCTGLDAPELVNLIRNNYKDVEWHRPKRGFFREMPQRGFPQRQRRWCCDYLKEGGGSGRIVITGVRWAESSKRSKRRQLETCFKDKSKQYFNPIIDWEDADVWDFIKSRDMEYCKLYDEGWTRLGCLLCPMTTGRMRGKEAERYPKYKQAWIRSFEKLYKIKTEKGHTAHFRWKSGIEMFEWWMNDNRVGEIPDQTIMFE